jgi:hypothetical protein
MTGLVDYSSSETYKMPRKKMVEGVILDLTDITGVPVDVTSIMAAEKEKKAAEAARKKAEKAAAAEKKKAERAAANEQKRIKKEAKKAMAEAKRIKKTDKVEKGDPLTFAKAAELHKCADCPTMILFHDRCSVCCKRDMNIKYAQMMKHIDSKGMNKCNFCGIPRGDDCNGFHFDHLNMFQKNGSVGSMMRSICSIDEICAEIDKCQLLCISCHLLVTKIEMRYGFTRRKIRLTRGEGDLDALIADYDRIMIPVYEEIKNKFRGGGGMVDER